MENTAISQMGLEISPKMQAAKALLACKEEIRDVNLSSLAFVESAIHLLQMAHNHPIAKVIKSKSHTIFKEATFTLASNMQELAYLPLCRMYLVEEPMPAQFALVLFYEGLGDREALQSVYVKEWAIEDAPEIDFESSLENERRCESTVPEYYDIRTPVGLLRVSGDGTELISMQLAPETWANFDSTQPPVPIELEGFDQKADAYLDTAFSEYLREWRNQPAY